MPTASEMLVVTRVLVMLANLLGRQLGPLWNLKDDIESMQSMMDIIKKALSDTQKRSLKKEAESERLWLRRLKSAAYEIEDLLSDFEASIAPNMTGRIEKIQQQVKMFFSSSNPVISHIALARKIKKMRKRLNKIVSEARDLHFLVDTNNSDQWEVLDQIKHRETCSEIDLAQRNNIVGRDEEKEKIINFLLLNDVGEDTSIISIVGLGGLGKTTLAQLVYNDERIKKQFDTIAWVHVSMNFDLLEIRKKILSQVGNGGQYDDSLQSVSTCLRSVVSDKRFLIVLDDLWEEHGKKLDDLNSILKGKPGSKIVVTSRSQRVAHLMSAKNGMVHSLEGVSDEYCWSIFSQRAFTSVDEVNPSLEEIGKEITKKCKGVPLAAIALGYILWSKKDTAFWSAVRDSEFWELDDDDLLPSLKLSYYYLSPPLKACFAYCAVFPKGFNINKDKLIQQWIALDLIQRTNENFSLERIAEEYVSIFFGMSFLQHSQNYEKSQNLLYMHDLVHDLARSVVGDEMVVLDDRKALHQKRYSTKFYSYYSLFANYDSMEASLDWKVLPNKIRALHFTNCTRVLFPHKVFSKKKSLRVLNLSGCRMKNLPHSIYHLKLLRYLEVSVVKAKSLHKSFCNLINMEALDLSKSSLEKLPSSIDKLEKLKSLRLHGCSFLGILPESFSKLRLLTHLDLSDCRSLQLLPESLGNLSNLCFLQLPGCSKLQILPESIIHLKNLIHLDMSGCSSLKVLPELFGDLSSLQRLFISGCSELKRLPETFGNLYKLNMLDLSDNYKLKNLPESFCNLEKLEHLNLSLCNNLEWLPEHLGNLIYLKSLNLSSCNALCNLPKSFLFLVNLEEVDLSYCCNLEEFPESIVNSGKLQMLDLRGCPSLVKFITTIYNYAQSQEGFILLADSEMFECKEIERGGKCCNTILMLQHLNQIRGKLCITCIETLESSEDAERAKLCNKSMLHTVTLQWSSNTRESLEDAIRDELVLEKLQPHQNLGLLTLDGYRGTRFPGWVMELESSLPNLTQITMCNLPHCEQLPPVEHLTNLESLEIQNISNIKRVRTDIQPSKGSFKKLRILSIREMPKLEEWSMTSSINDIKLERLEIYRCPRVIFRPCLPSTDTSVITESSMSLSSVNLASPSSMSRISKMCIENCNMTSDEWGGLGCYVIKDLEIKSCKDMHSLPKGIVGVTSLESLTINDCNCLSVLPEWKGKHTSLKCLSINQCPNLKYLPLSLHCLTALENIFVRDCCPELVDLCEGVNRNLIHHDPKRLLVLVRGEEHYCIGDLLSASVEVLGDGTFGTTFKAKLDNEQVVAIKRLKKVKTSQREFMYMIAVLSAMNHPNLMPLNAYFYRPDEKLLVYDYMPIGSLSLWLHGKKHFGPWPMLWSTRTRMALAIAHGLKYIHAISPQYAHGNIKSSNILLSGNSGFPEEAKIADYGLVHLTGNLADDAYKAPEVTDIHQVTQKSDVYSFGVLLMELLTGKNPECTDDSGTSFLSSVPHNFQWEWVDFYLLKENLMEEQEVRKMMQLAVECVTTEPERRPTMEMVVHRIEGIYKLMQDRSDGIRYSIDDSWTDVFVAGPAR